MHRRCSKTPFLPMSLLDSLLMLTFDHDVRSHATISSPYQANQFPSPESRATTCYAAPGQQQLTTKRASTALNACLSTRSPTTCLLLISVRDVHSAAACLRAAGQPTADCCSPVNLPLSTANIPASSGCSQMTHFCKTLILRNDPEQNCSWNVRRKRFLTTRSSED